MEDKEIALRKKAELISSGTLYIPRDIAIPFPLSRSSAGPGAGIESIVVSFSGMRVKVPVSRIEGKFQLRRAGSSFEILVNGELFCSDVSIIPTLCHAPGQAFVTLCRTCKLDCLFCSINESGRRGKGEISVDEAFRLIVAASKKPDFHGVAITSGISTTVDDQIERIAELVRLVRESFPEIPIGVEPIVTSMGHVKALRKAGATELKINIEAATKEIFDKVCPARDYELTHRAVGWAVSEFGRNHVTSNIIIGLGESDEDVLKALEKLAELGAVGNLRGVRVNEFNRDRLVRALGKNIGITPERLLTLCKHQEEIFIRHGLSARHFKTMCFPCGCCDLVPEIDY